jgi:hypothetical protein
MGWETRGLSHVPSGTHDTVVYTAVHRYLPKCSASNLGATPVGWIDCVACWRELALPPCRCSHSYGAGVPKARTWGTTNVHERRIAGMAQASSSP